MNPARLFVVATAAGWIAQASTARSDPIADFVQPKPINIGASGGIGGIPRLANGDLMAGTAGVELVIDPTGRVSGCRRVYPVDASSLADWLCHGMRIYARYHPAIDRDGSAISGVHIQWLRSSINAFLAPGPDQTDLTIPIRRFPPGSTIRKTVMIRDLVDAGGRIEACGVVTTSRSAALDRVACALTDKEILPVMCDSAGNPVRSVRERLIGFTKAE